VNKIAKNAITLSTKKASHRKAKITKCGIASSHLTNHSHRLSLISNYALTLMGYVEVVMTDFTSTIRIGRPWSARQWRKSRDEVTNDPNL